MADKDDFPDFEPIDNVSREPAQNIVVDDPDFIPASDNELEAALERVEYDQPLAAGVAGALSSVTFGASDVIGSQLGYKEELQKLREYNPYATGVGEAGGVAGSLLFSGPLGLLSKGTQKAVGKTILKEGAKASAKRKALGRAVVEGVEGAAIGAGQTVSQVALSNKEYTPEDVAESLISNVGMGVLIGAPLGAGLSITGTGVKRGLKKFIKQPISEGVEQGATKVATDALEEMPKVTGRISDDIYSGTNVLDDLTPGKEKTLEAFRELGIDSQSGKELIEQEADYFARQLGESDSFIAGMNSKQKANLRAKVQNNIISGLKKDLTPESARTAKEIGQEFIDSLKADIDNNSQLFKKTFGERTRDLKKVRVLTTQAERKSLANSLRRSEIMERITDTPVQRQVSKLINNIEAGRFKNARQLDLEISGLGGDAAGLLMTNKPAAIQLFKIQDVLKRAQNKDIIKSAIKATGGDEAAAKAVVSDFKSARRSYREFAKDLEQIAEFGGKKVKSPAKFREFLEKLEPEQVGKKFLEKNLKNTDNLEMLAKRFPDQYENLRKKYIVDLYDKHVDGDELKLLNFVKDANKLSPEAQDLIFTPQVGRKLRNLNTVFKYNKNLLKSPTQRKGTITGIMDQVLKELKDALFWGISKSLGLAKEAVEGAGESQLFKKGLILDDKVGGAVKGTENVIKKSVKKFLTVAEKGSRVANAVTVKSVLGTREDNEKRLEKFAQYSANPQLYVDNLVKNTRGMYAKSPEVADAMVNTAIESINFLANKMPQTQIGYAQEVLNEKPDYSDYQVATFNRYARAVENPLSILDDMESGTLTPQAIEAVRTIYPNLMNEIQTQTMDELAKKRPNLTYGKKIQLSMLLGFPVSDTMKPEFIKRMQQSSAAPQEQSPQVRSGANIDVAQNYETSMQKVQQMS